MVRESPTTAPTRPDGGTLRIADTQTYVRPAIAFHIFILLFFFLFDAGGYICLAIWLALLLFFAVKAFQQLRALGNRLAPLWASLSFFPVIGLVILINLNAAATRRLRAAGLTVRFLGVPKAERQTLRDALNRESGTQPQPKRRTEE